MDIESEKNSIEVSRMNSLGRDGSPLKCWTCSSVFHIQRSCEKYKGKNERFGDKTNSYRRKCDPKNFVCDEYPQKWFNSTPERRDSEVEVHNLYLEIKDLKVVIQNKELMIDNLI